MVCIDDCQTPDETIDFLVHQTPDRTTDAASHDALLVFEFFPLCGEGFQNCPDFEEEHIEQFKESFAYEQFGLDRENTLQRIRNFRSIERILDMLVMLMPADIKQELMKKYLLEIWFKQNSSSDLEHFKSSLNNGYWFTE